VLVYTLMRVGLFLAVWLLLQLITPLRGLWALFVAVIVSGVLSAFVLNRQRTAMGEVVGGFFGRINARIDAASRAEDEWDEDERAEDERAEDDRDERELSALENDLQHQAGAQGEGVDDHQPTGGDQGRDESGSAGSGHDDSQGSPSPGERGESH